MTDTGMKTNGFSRAGWALAGLAMGSAVGFFAGRYWPPDETAGHQQKKMLSAERMMMEAGSKKDSKADGGISGNRAGGKVPVPLGESPQQTLRNILAITDSLGRMAALKEWCDTLTPDQMVSVMKEFQKMMEAQERVGEVDAHRLFFQSIDVMTQSVFDRGPERMLAFFLAPAAPGEDAAIREGLGGEVFRKWAEQDPAAARALLEARLAKGAKIGELEKGLTTQLMRAWITKEPEAAMAWLLKQPDEIGKDAVSPAFQALSHTDPDKARALVEAQADLPGRDEIAATIAQWWAMTTPGKAMEWAKGLPEKLAGPSVKKAMETWAGQDFPAAKRALEEMSGPAREAALPVLVEKWEKDNWGEAAAFLDRQTTGKGKQDAMGLLIRHWADGDQQAASAWLAKQTAGPERDAGAAALAEEVRGSDPEAAAIWGSTLGDDRLRQSSLKDTFQAWYKKSVPEALRWLESAPLSDADRAMLLGNPPSK